MSTPWVAIQRNPTSGTGNRASLLKELIHHLKQKGIRPRLFSNRERMQERVLQKSAEDPPLCIVAAGGDGTVQEMINRYPDQRIAILPLGTENLLARYLSIPKSGQFVAEMISQGVTREIDLCQMDERKFILMASIGFDAAVVLDLSLIRKGNISRLSYLNPIWKTLCSYSFEPLHITAVEPGQVRELTGYHAIVVNISAYGLNLNFAPEAQDSDGLLDLILFEKKGLWNMLKYVFRIMRGTHLGSEGVQILQAKEIRIQSAHPVPVQTDGDATGMTPATIRIIPAAGRFIVPCSTRSNDQ
ncbi:diacylglycerol kinase family protein [uncultured Gimesia sp.]|uniref:diacylglycerol/lipid kinase family protein n=1 Tax=uncultured Gimesia sp. TaxID=1678688 RepID=UPI0026137040|nr:diacylglycerol kinase family protein [uncultured Gimesia sp.]